MFCIQTWIEIFTDGSCLGNPGLGGWGAILRCRSTEKELFGWALITTNNRMELLAIIEALGIVTQSCKVRLYTDSQYVRTGVLGWTESWKIRGELITNLYLTRNKDLWRYLNTVLTYHDINWYWIHSHVGTLGNERVDILAKTKIGLKPICHLIKMANCIRLDD